MELAETYRALYTLRYVPVTWVQVVFSAGTVFILSAVQATSGSRLAHVSLSHSLSQVDLCIQYLSETGRSWNAANNISDILKSLRKEQLIPRLNLRSIDESKIAAGMKRSISSAHSQFSEDIKPPLTASSMDSFNPLSIDDDITSVTSSPPTDISNLSNSLRVDSWDLGGGNTPMIWNDPTVDMGGQSWIPPDSSYNFLGSNGDLQDYVGGFPGLTGGETLPTQPFMPFGIMVGANRNDGDYYRQQYNYSQQQQPRQLTEEDVQTLNQFLGQQVR